MVRGADRGKVLGSGQWIGYLNEEKGTAGVSDSRDC